MLAGSAVFHRFQTTSVGRDIAADKRTVGAAWFPRIQITFFQGDLMYVSRSNSRFHDHHHIDFVDFENLVHPLRRQHEPALISHRRASIARSGATRHDRYQPAVRQLKDFSDFGGIGRQYDGFRVMNVFFACHLIVRIRFEFLTICPDIFFADNLFQFSEGARIQRIICTHVSSPYGYGETDFINPSRRKFFVIS